MNKKPRIFIASSTESYSIAQAINHNLDRPAETVLWTRPEPSQNFIDSLIKLTRSVDFAAFLCTPDDLVIMRGEEKKTTRDNVLFELGLFMGYLGKERCFIILPRDSKHHTPTDILGIAPIDYEPNRSDNDFISATKSTCTVITNVMDRMGFFHTNPQKSGLERNDFQLIDSFPKKGQKISTDDIKKIFLKFNKPVDRNSVMYIGNYYIQENTFAQWNGAGWIQFDEDDTKLIWHIHEHLLSHKSMHGPLEIDYPRFEIHIGREPEEWRLKDIDGNSLPLIKLPVTIKN
ncbi:nucleotide-binding protein [Nitrosomonas sp. sh817]|uniref:nucleotide-binding protein n=1 Tax=Nitrosomonas sp. sh817 TaxID=3070658 RepID=UPI0027DB8B9C|nr:nucleotide-binding protein [Nitrosomonas sp. sh817]WMJ09621.1 nucleotide-binding protein [Nitrosomonas sp. sh817]